MKPFQVNKQLNIEGLDNHLAQVQLKLETVALKPGSPLNVAISRLIHAPSKRMRSCIVMACAAQNNQPISNLTLEACAAIELVHLASLVHDDIMDDADVRWNVPTISSQEGLDQAILAGDYLFACANMVASGISAQVASTIAQTIIALCEGQAKELADIQNIDRTPSEYLKAIRGKTGSLAAAACRVGALTAGLEPAKVKALTQFGERFGIAYQLLDDVLDFISTTEAMGKPSGNDIAEGIYTLPVILALNGPHRKQMLAILQNPARVRSESAVLLVHEGYIRKAIKEVHKYNTMAKESIDKFASRELQTFPEAYTDWALAQLVNKA